MEKSKTNNLVEYSQNFTILEEITDLKPTEEEVRLYAKGLGIDPDREEYLLPIAREGVSARLPTGWLVLKSRDGSIFYQQQRTGIVVWEHPLDSQFRAKVAEARKKRSNSLSTEPLESNTVYRQLPEPKSGKNKTAFKVPTVPPVHNDSNSGSGSIPTISISNMPHIQSSPTQYKTEFHRKALTERNDLSKSVVSIPNNLIRRNFRDENADPSIEQLADRLRTEVHVSIPNVRGQDSSAGQPRQEVPSSTRKLFDEDQEACVSSLFSPPESPDRRHYCTPVFLGTPGCQFRTDQRVTVSAVSPIDELFALEFDSNVSLRYLLEEQTRLHDKIAVLKATYKAYKARLASINSSISMLQSTRAAAVIAATAAGTSPTKFPTSAISRISPGNCIHSSSLHHHRCRSHSTTSRRPSRVNTISPATATASESHHQHRKAHQRPVGDDRDRRFSIQSMVSKQAPRSVV